MSPSTHAPPKETHLLIQVIFSLTACFIAIYFFVHLFRAPSSISPSPASSAPPPVSPAYPSHHQHNGPTSQLSSPSPGDLAAYNFFCHSSSSLVKSIRSGLAPASAEVRLPLHFYHPETTHRLISLVPIPLSRSLTRTLSRFGAQISQSLPSSSSFPYASPSSSGRTRTSCTDRLSNEYGPSPVSRPRRRTWRRL
jgi:hypothetical protein